MGGRLLARDFLTPQALPLVGEELQAQAEAVRAIEVSGALKIEAATTMAQIEAQEEAAEEDWGTSCQTLLLRQA